MRRLLPVAVLAAALLAFGASSLGAARSATPYDGMLFEMGGQSYTFNSGSPGCPSLLGHGTERSAETRVLRPSDTGEGLATRIGYAVSVNSSANGSPVAIRGSAPLPQTGMSIGFNTPLSGTDPQANCSPRVPIGSSAAGELYAIDWSIGCQNGGNCPTNPVTGTGCAAYSQFNVFLAVVVELGTCTPSAFPAPPAYGSGLKALTARSLNGDLIKVAGDDMMKAGTAVGGCGNAPKAQYDGPARGETLIRPALPTPLGLISVVGFDLNTRGLAYGWAVSIDVFAQGKVRSLALQSSPPGSFSPPKCQTWPKAQKLTQTLPVGVWLGGTYLGRAWVRLTTRLSGAWSAEVAFGKPNFTSQ